MPRARRSRGLVGWMLGVLAALTLVAAAPEHVLDLDEASGSAATAAAEVQAHGLLHTVVDHATPGHACAAHCAAHAIGDAPLPVAMVPPTRTPLAWPAATARTGRAHAPALFDRPPKA